MQISKREFLKKLGLGGLGLAAGAALAATTGVRPRDLDVKRLQRTLEKNHAYVG